MKVRFFFYELRSAFGHPPSIRRASMANDSNVEKSVLFNKNLLSALDTDFSENRSGFVDQVLSNVECVETGQVESYEWEGDGFTHHITRSRVRFEHTIFGDCPEYPIWCCTLAQYKSALLGYRHFLDMPKSLGSELIIELPEGEPENCY